MIMDDHKWGFALEEAVKELETEYNKKEQKSKKHKHKKWGIIRRITGGGKKKSTKEEEDEKATPEHDKSDPSNVETENNNREESTVEERTEKLCHSPIVDLKQSCSSPIMSGNYPDRKKRTPRKTGVAERNETERQVVYRTLKNYNQINKLHDYDLV